METLIGLGIGILATAIISHYYYKLTHKKSLTPFITANTVLFSGIDPEVRAQLKFLYNDEEVGEIQQLEFLIANDGERPITKCIEPLTLELPRSAKILDVSVVHRHPSSLKVDVSVRRNDNGSSALVFGFPLLNKRNFFLVKVLVRGKVERRAIVFRVVADDLPNVLLPRLLPPMATRKERFAVDWGAIVVGLILLSFALSWIYGMYLLYAFRPDLFPYPWASYSPTLGQIIALVCWVLGPLATGMLAGITLLTGIGVDDLLNRSPRFPLPDDYRRTPPSIDLEVLSQKIDRAE